MKKFLKKIIEIFINIISIMFLFFLRKFKVNIPKLNKIFKKNGFLIFKKHYYLPIPSDEEISFEKDSSLTGITIEENIINDFFHNIIKYQCEFKKLLYDKNILSKYNLFNGTFMAIDSDAYYSIIRCKKPRRIIEIGSGNSTLVAIEAIKENFKECGIQEELTCIEPFPPKYLTNLNYSFLNLIIKKLQEIKLDFFINLEKNDILFIDSTHVLKSGGDVWYEYCEILPRLKEGVFIHVHDIYLPRPYGKIYYDQDLYWNEQYLLQSFLTFNYKYQIIFPSSYYYLNYKNKLEEYYSSELKEMKRLFPDSIPSSFWMTVKNT